MDRSIWNRKLTSLPPPSTDHAHFTDDTKAKGDTNPNTQSKEDEKPLPTEDFEVDPIENQEENPSEDEFTNENSSFANSPNDSL